MSFKTLVSHFKTKGPIERKVLLLVVVLVLLAVTFTGTETIRRTAINDLRSNLENQSARRNLGKIILQKLLHIEKNTIMLAAAIDARDVRIIHAHMEHDVAEIKKILTILQHGGTYANILPMNFGSVDEVTESISFFTRQASRYVMEVIDLTPKIIDIEQDASDMQTAVLKKIAAQTVPTAPIDRIALLQKQMDATIIRSRETANKINYDTSLRINTLDAEIADVSRRFVMVRNTVSVVVFLVGMAVCILTLGQIRTILGERASYARKLGQANETINKIVEALPVGIAVINPDRTIGKLNNYALKMIGVESADQIRGKTCHALFCLAGQENCPIASGNMRSLASETILNTRSGTRVPVIKRAINLRLGNRAVILEAFVDISDRVNAENELKEAEARIRRLNEELEQRVVERTSQLQTRNEELKAALRELKTTQDMLLQSEKLASIGQLAAGVAHEINNPIGFVGSNLTTIDEYLTDLSDLIGLYESMREQAMAHADTSRELNDAIRSVAAAREAIDLDFIQNDVDDVLRQTREGIDRVAGIVADLKNFAHMDGDEREWASVNEVLESTLNIVWNELKYKADVVKDLATLPSVECYPQRLGQVFMNLLVNAAQAIEDKGTIRIATRDEGDRVRVCISDTGCGIPEAHLKRIYDPFFTTKKVGQGTGLGLNVVYNIVKSHQGTVEVESRPGEGTTFTLVLPIELPDESLAS